MEAMRDPGAGKGRGVKQAGLCLVAQNGDCTPSRSPLGPHTSPELPCAGERQAACEYPWVSLPSRAE